MSDAYPLPKNIPQGPDPNALPPAQGVAQQMPDLAKRVSSLTNSSNYQALQPPKTETPEIPYDTKKAVISTFPGIASLLGASPSEVEDAKQWKKLHDTANIAKQDELLQNNPAYGNAVSATEGAISGATLGAPEALQKMIGDQAATNTTQMLKDKYGLANTLGQVGGGLASSLALPGAGELMAAKGGALAAKGIVPFVARQALNAATFAVPTALTQGIATGDPGQTWQDLKQNMLYGTVGGVVVGKLLGGAPKVAKAMEEVADDMALTSAGINPKILKSVAGGGVAGKAGSSAERLANLKSEVSDMITKNGLGSKADIEDFVNGKGKIWDEVDHAFQNSGAKPSEYLDEVVNHPDIQKLLASPEYGQQVGDYVQKILGNGDSLVDLAKATGQSALPDIRKILMTDMKNGFKATDVPTQLRGEVAGAIHDVIDGHFVPAELKQEWPALKMLKLGSERMESTVKGVEPGSPTAPREILARMLGGGEGGAAIGAMQTKDFDPSDPGSWANLGINMTLGTVAGSMANKGLARLANHIGGKTAGFLKGLSNVAGKIAPAGGEALGSKAAEFLGGGHIGQIGAATPLMGPITSQPPSNPPDVANAPAGAVPIANAPPQMDPKDQPQVDFNSAGQSTEPVGHWSPTFVNSRIQEMYSRFARQGYANGISLEQFKNHVLQGTNNLDADNPDTWMGMYDNPETAKKMYSDYKALSNLPLNEPKDTFTPSALNHYLRLIPTGKNVGRFTPEDRVREEQANTILVQTLSELLKKTPKEIDTRLRQIAFMHTNGNAKRQMIMDMIVKEGKVDVLGLKQTGLW